MASISLGCDAHADTTKSLSGGQGGGGRGVFGKTGAKPGLREPCTCRSDSVSHQVNELRIPSATASGV